MRHCLSLQFCFGFGNSALELLLPDIPNHILSCQDQTIRAVISYYKIKQSVGSPLAVLTNVETLEDLLMWKNKRSW